MTTSLATGETTSLPAEPAIHLAGVVVALGGFPALAGVDLVVRCGELVALRGANGTGKSTLLRLCAGLAPLTRGSAHVLGFDVARQRDVVRAMVGLLGHDNGLYADLTARENVEFVAQLVGAGTNDVESALDRLGIDSRVAAARAGALSAGQRRRTALAALIVRRARLWLLDEPHAGLDGQARAELDGILRDATRSGATVVYTTHESEVPGARIPRTITLSGGIVARDVDSADPS
ncbi:MAG: heme ABC exporter ATP-binding protein CcmA [Ilumatobacteraceae bacterium]